MPRRPDDGQGRVIVIGDSLTFGAQPELEQLLTQRQVPHDIVAVPGVSTVWAFSILDDLDPQPDDLVVVALGTNDAVTAPRRFGELVDRIADRVPGLVVWLTLDRPGGQALNAVLYDVVAGRDDAMIADWEQTAIAYPAWKADDQIHYTAAGYQLRAEFITEVVAALH